MRSNNFESGGPDPRDTHSYNAPAPFHNATASEEATPIVILPSPLFIHSDGQKSPDAQALSAVAPFSNGGGQMSSGTHNLTAPATPSCDQGRFRSDTLAPSAEVAPLCEEGQEASAAQFITADLTPFCREGQAISAAPFICADPALIQNVIETHRRRVDLMRAMGKLTLQMKAVCRRFCDGDKDAAAPLWNAINGKGEHAHAAAALAWCEPLLMARDTIEDYRKAEEKKLAKLAKQLPVAEWVEAVPGFGVGSLGAVIGESGDLSKYGNPAKLWKRMGLAVINGGRQRRVAGDEALIHGYSPERRSIMWNIGACLIKQQGPWRELYLARLATEHQKALDEGLIPATSTKVTVDSWAKRGLPELTKVTKITAAHRSAGHMNNRAQRYIEKRLLRDLWRAWRQS